MVHGEDDNDEKIGDWVVIEVEKEGGGEGLGTALLFLGIGVVAGFGASLSSWVIWGALAERVKSSVA
jgi:hypothetical protein